MAGGWLTVAYNPKEIEPRWQKHWEEEGFYRSVFDPSRTKYYVLEMFPYPSGKLHMGHMRNYSIGDVLARFLRMRAIMFASHGLGCIWLPAENADRKPGEPGQMDNAKY